jgi:hypothetical protein
LRNIRLTQHAARRLSGKVGPGTLAEVLNSIPGFELPICWSRREMGRPACSGYPELALCRR